MMLILFTFVHSFLLITVAFSFVPDFVKTLNETVTASPLMAATTAATAAAATATAAATSSDMSALKDLIKVLKVISSWDPIITYGIMAIGFYKTCSSTIEVFYEKACFEVEKAKYEKFGELIHFSFIHFSFVFNWLLFFSNS